MGLGMRGRAWLVVVALLACGAAQAAPLKVTLFAINDLHGNLQPPPGGVTIPDPKHPGARTNIAAGGVARMATLLKQRRALHPRSAFVAAGDLIGASPLLSRLFHDEPTVEALSLMGLEASAAGNHEFDDGAAELLRLQKGGCPAEGCNGQPPFAGARFHYLAANVTRTGGAPLLPPYYIKQFGGVKVAFVGLVLRGTPAIVTPSGVAGLSFGDEADSVNALVPELKARGIEAIVVLIHQGAETTGERDACPTGGPILDIMKRLDKAVDVVVSGHTHQAYVCTVDGRLLTSAYRYGMMVTQIDLALDTRTGDVTAARASNLLVRPELKPDPAIARLIARTENQVAALSGRVVGQIAAPLPLVARPGGTSAMGDLVTDAMLAGMKGAQIAFMNPGGLRAEIPRPGPVTYGALFAVLPFGNRLVAMTLTGAQIAALLEQQWSAGATRILQVSRGFSYRWDGTRPAGARVVPGSITLDGAPVQPDRRYRVVVNDFLANGGDGMTVLLQGTEGEAGGSLLDAVTAYLGARNLYTSEAANRITRVD